MESQRSAFSSSVVAQPRSTDQAVLRQALFLSDRHDGATPGIYEGMSNDRGLRVPRSTIFV
jgi:hypothetical protein